MLFFLTLFSNLLFMTSNTENFAPALLLLRKLLDGIKQVLFYPMGSNRRTCTQLLMMFHYNLGLFRLGRWNLGKTTSEVLQTHGASSFLRHDYELMVAVAFDLIGGSPRFHFMIQLDFGNGLHDWDRPARHLAERYSVTKTLE